MVFLTRYINHKVISVLMTLTFVFQPFVIYAQSTSTEQRAALEAELKKLEAEIKEQEGLLNDQKKKTGVISGDLKKISDQIAAKRTEIAAKQKLISNLSSQIGQKDSTIKQLTSELTREKESLARLVRKMREVEDASLPEFLLDSKTVSEYFSDFDNSSFIQDELQGSLRTTRIEHDKTVDEKEVLEDKKTKEAEVRAKLEAERQKAQVDHTKKNSELTDAKKVETKISNDIAARKKEVAKIQARLFELRGQKGISFGSAYDYARKAEAKTGVSAAFVLAILKQESNLGKNVGTCNRPGDARTWKDIMPGPDDGSWRDDQKVYLEIMSDLGRSPDGQPLSCPIGKGWGGAMGPSQFIPTTWKSYASRIAKAVGESPADPWNPEHAITATSLYLSDLGAGSTYESLKQAACKYYSGRACASSTVFYGNAVVSHAKGFEADIKLIESI
ncbi:MAG TPA: lytic murein transglycosylase [Candidatus Paceibacterota bacterium]